jgi:aldehyde dehydrogenase (NAD+)
MNIPPEGTLMGFDPSTLDCTRFYVAGQWIEPVSRVRGALVNPATEQTIALVSYGSAGDVDHAVAAAKRAFDDFSTSTKAARVDLLRRVLEIYTRRYDDFVSVLPVEMGAPISLARDSQVYMGVAHLTEILKALEAYDFVETIGSTQVVHEPIGVAGLITPWNWPLNQIVTKVAAALASGCTIVLKPSEYTPLDAVLFAEVLHEAGVPAGVFNMIHGDGPTTGNALTVHPDVDVVSFTGSTRAGVAIAMAAAPTVKRVHQELGGKSANILLDDVDLEVAVSKGISNCYSNAGQSCSVSTRMLVPASLHDRVCVLAKQAAEKYVVGDPLDNATTMGPLANEVQFGRVNAMIEAGIREGATLVAGGPGRPAGITRGFFVRPTVFGDVSPSMSIAQEEIFGPVLSIIKYKDLDDAVRIANGTNYGLACVVQSSNAARAAQVARRIRAGHIYINHHAAAYASAPFGGLKRSGNGYEHGRWGIEAFVALKAILGVQ